MKFTHWPAGIAFLRRCIIRTGLLASALSPVLVHAQWPHRVDLIKPLTSTNNLGDHIAIAPDGAGGVTVAWRDNRDSTTSGRDIYAQRIGVNGVAQWTDDGVAVIDVAGTQENVLLAPAASAGVYVVWSDSRVANSPRLHAQLLNADGEKQWAEDGVRVGPNEFNQSDFAVAADGAGNLLVTWKESNNNFRTFAQKIDATGAPLWGAGGFEYSSGVFEGGEDINIVPDEDGGAVVGWIRFGDNPRTVHVQRILANGTAAFAFVTVAADVEALLGELAMTPDGTGGAIIGWKSDDGVNDNLYVQCVDGDGNLPWGAASTILVEQPNVQDNLHIVSDGAGGAYCAWDDPRTDVDNVYVQRFNADGVAQWAANGVAAGVATAQRFTARLIADGAGGAIVTYRQNQDGTFSQRFDSLGTRLWTDNGFQITNNASVNFPVISTDAAQGIILAVLSFTGGNIPAVKRVLGAGAFPISRLVNISTRAFVGTGADVLVPGFVINGSGEKTVLIRAAGPVLATDPFNVSGVIADPLLTLFNSQGQSIASNDDWEQAPNLTQLTTIATQVSAFDFPAGGKDAALLATLAPGLYTASVAGVGDGTGVGLVEVYDADTGGAATRAINISCRAMVGTGDNTLIPGFVVEGIATITLLVRGIGPTLSADPFNVPGVLADPVLTLFNSDGGEIGANDDWGVGNSATLIAQTAAAVQAFALPPGSKDAVILVTLGPGLYTVQLSGVGNTTGVALVELYEVP